jgi:hypothetical protein
VVEHLIEEFLWLKRWPRPERSRISGGAKDLPQIRMIGLPSALQASKTEPRLGEPGMTQARLLVALTTLIFALGRQTSLAQTAPDASTKLRPVHDNTIISPELPKADLTLGNAFRYLGGQKVNLYSMAEAEQHLFVRGGSNGVIDAFYWIQFEHRAPSDSHTYNYQLGHSTEIGGLDFVYDEKAWPDYASELLDDPASDGAAISRLLAKSSLKFPERAARVRMFHLPTPDHRSELMIIYGEALAEESTIRTPKEGVDLMKESPSFAQKLLANLKAQLTINPE